jgi:dephospho-CoA kinase
VSSSVFHIVVAGYAAAGKSELVRFLLREYCGAEHSGKYSTFDYDATDFIDNNGLNEQEVLKNSDDANSESIVIPVAIRKFFEAIFANLTTDNTTLKILSFNYDKLAHLVLSASSGVNTVQERGELATEVFREQSKLKSLEALIHPATYALASSIFEVALKQNTSPTCALLVVHEIPLWWETRELFIEKFGKNPDRVVVLTIDEETQISRLKKRGYDLDRIKQIHQKQLKHEDWEDIQLSMPNTITIF